MSGRPRSSSTLVNAAATVVDDEGDSADPGAARDEAAPTVDAAHADDFDHDYDFDDSDLEIVRLRCPDCARPIAVLEEEPVLPEHALLPTPWNPFGLRVCSGSGLPVEAAEELPAPCGEAGDALAALLTLPEGLHWRTQPFSHPDLPLSSVGQRRRRRR
ncbi:hypothetical protein [Allostreptomyces psammosilenae]|uniref:Uncharacterized protein n=1 Tax=Allostreptomyces psammosilenae TaxID=1892865 RepID=A0A852ZU21_9ACTN|nr:hypothetical protein [Allostreptomyces psammosilenae]NYI04264.1 hypothetical protein [Allostreptomyces psammosilenae]